VYVARAHLALNPPSVSAAEAVLAPWLASDSAPPSARAAAALAGYLAGKGGVDTARDIVLEVEGEGGEEGVVRALVGTVFVLDKEIEEAVATLSEGAGAEDLECVALLVQLCLALDRRDLANGQYAIAKKIGNDSTLVQSIEAWIGLKTGARPLHQAYYFYEELYQLPNGRTPQVLAAHAAAHLLLGHVDEAKADILEAKESAPEDPAVLAVAVSLGDADAEA
jgi:coatomer protein complex subunit epsilon